MHPNLNVISMFIYKNLAVSIEVSNLGNDFVAIFFFPNVLTSQPRIHGGYLSQKSLLLSKLP